MRTRLRHVARVNPLSRRFDDLDSDALVPFLPMERVWPGKRLDLSETRPKSAVASGYTRFESGDVLVPKITPTFEAGRSVLVPELPDSVGVGTTELHVVRASAAVDQRYLLYQFLTHRFLKVGESKMYGVAGQKRVPDDLLRDWEIDLPSIDEQQRVATFLDSETRRIDDLIEVQQVVSRLLQERRSRVLEDLLIRGQELSGSVASWTSLGSLTQHGRPIMYGIVLPGPNVAEGVPIVKGGDVAAGRLSLAQLNKTTFEIESTYARSRLRAGDLVISIRGSVGEVAAVPGEVEGANLTQDAARIAPGEGVSGRWLELVLQAPSVEAQIQSKITGATIRGINIWDLRRILVPRVPLADQCLAANHADAVLRTMAELDSKIDGQLTVLAERRQALISAAVTGQIDVTTARGVDV